MKEFRVESGFIVFEMSATENTQIGGIGICDFCNKADRCMKGYLIPVLSSWYCTNCFKNWLKDSTRYDEDTPTKNIKHKCTEFNVVKC